MAETLREQDRALGRLGTTKTLSEKMERTQALGPNVESMRKMLSVSREITYWREAYQ